MSDNNINMEDFMEKYPACKDLLSQDQREQISDICNGASDSGAACGAIQVVGGGESEVCENTSAKLIKKKVEVIKNCQKSLYEYTVKNTMKILVQNDSKLVDSLILQDQIFQTRLNIFESELNSNIIILNIVSCYNFIAIVVLIFFLCSIKNFR
tara:strand:+ start:634 stop:1095 length:462 start_codon:yes stop_codon:yes gene_type:complete